MTPRFLNRCIALVTLLALSSPLASFPIAASPAEAVTDGAMHAWETASDAVPRFESATCPFPLDKGQTEGTNVTCGFVVVPEDHANPTGPTIRLATAQFRATSKFPAPEPIVYLEGGPGAAAIGQSTASFAARFTASRDFVIFDQRGTG